MTDSERRRLRRSVALHCIAVAVFAMLAFAGSGIAVGAPAVAAPFIVVGLAGAVGAGLIAVSVWRTQSQEAAAIKPSGPPQRTIRLAMAAAAVLALFTGVALAPQGVDRGFVIGVAAFLAALLALFALLAGDRPRTAVQPVDARDPS